MSFEADIERALFDRCEALTLAPALPIQYPNLPFTSPADGYWLDVLHFRNRNRNLAWGAETEHLGFLQVGVVSPSSVPQVRALDTAGIIAAWFAKGTDLRYGSAVVRIQEKPSVESPVQDGHKLIIPVSIPYRCFAT